jgi:hypothetical protein
MIVEWMTLLSAMAATPQASRPVYNCPEAVRAAARAYRLSELPDEIRKDLMALTNDKITDENIPLLATDAPSEAERKHATVRFAQALRFHNYWLVQIEVALFAGVRTISFESMGNGPFRFSPGINFQGPACASIRAALDGVSSPLHLAPPNPAYPSGAQLEPLQTFRWYPPKM